jgi:hypothetical protein
LPKLVLGRRDRGHRQADRPQPTTAAA